MSKKKKNSNQSKNDVATKTAVEVTEASEPSAVAAGELTEEQIEVELDELAKTPKRERIWEIDFLRGLMILFVVWDHFMWDVNSIGSNDYNSKLFQWLYEVSNVYYDGSLRGVTHDVFVTMFVLTSGVSCSFSRSNGKRALKMMAFAILLSAATYAISAIMNTRLTIYFNVIHVVALSVTLYAGIEWIWARCVKNWQKNIFGVVMFAITMTALIVGSCAKDMGTHWTNVIFGESEWRTEIIKKFRRGSDYLAFLPDFGWFLVGVFLGKCIYKERKSVFPSVDARYVLPVTFCGRHSLWVYFISQIVMFGFVYLLHDMFNIL